MPVKPIVFIGESRNSTVYVARQHAFLGTYAILALCVEKYFESMNRQRPISPGYSQGMGQLVPGAVGGRFPGAGTACPRPQWMATVGTGSQPVDSGSHTPRIRHRARRKSDQVRPSQTFEMMNPPQNARIVRSAIAKPKIGHRPPGPWIAGLRPGSTRRYGRADLPVRRPPLRHKASRPPRFSCHSSPVTRHPSVALRGPARIYRPVPPACARNAPLETHGRPGRQRRWQNGRPAAPSQLLRANPRPIWFNAQL